LSIVPRILIIDGNRSFRFWANHVLSARWPEAVITEWDPEANGRPGTDFYWSNYDLVLLDDLPDTPGQPSWLEYLSAQKKCPPILFLVDGDAMAVGWKAIKTGAADFISKKALTKERLVETVTSLLTKAAKQKEKEQADSPEPAAPSLDTTQRTQIGGAAMSPTPQAGADDIVAVDGYEILRKLSDGGTSVIFLARKQGGTRDMALKIINRDLSEDSSFIRQFTREYRLIASITSPYVVRIFDYGSTNGHFYIAMEYFAGHDLKERMSAAMPPDQASAIFIEILKALRDVHEYGIVHRDIKPENIMFRGDETLGLIDFGNAKPYQDSPNLREFMKTLTQQGHMVGTPLYMSPEQCNGAPADQRSDLYSAGVTFYEMLTNQRLFNGSNVVELVIMHLEQPIPRLPEHLVKFQGLLDKLLAKDPDQRYASAKDVIEDLELL
jgi:predicted Ser/Thr protein kinase/DNA-binding NarL/FixJ family response regulator